MIIFREGSTFLDSIGAYFCFLFMLFIIMPNHSKYNDICYT